MRIIGGTFRGRRFYPPADRWPTRPTTDFAKEALFNILMNRLDFASIKMLDLFGGTGSHSYEAVSLGCQDVTYVDKHIPAVKFVKETCATLGIADYVHIVRSDVLKYLAKESIFYDYVFAGPPYGLPWLDEIPNMVLQNGWLARTGLFVLEHNQHHDFNKHEHFRELRTYGGTHFSFFQTKEGIAE
ncbi:MAG: methyltransferase [Saprospiraceae bacterium]|nr:methyltransferase [Saprospiraceae bacterium]